MKIYSLICQYWAQTHAATAIEYGLMLASISLAIFATVFVFGDSLVALFQSFRDAIALAL